MHEKNTQVAMRIKSLREISGVSPQDLAGKLKLTREQYEAYENGTAEIPVSILFEIANQFKVELTSLLTGEEPKLNEYSLVRKGKGPQVERRKEYSYQDLAYNFKNKRAEIFYITVPAKPSDEKQKPYWHAGQEFTHVLEGTLKIILDKHELVLNEGDSLYFDSRHPHMMVAMNNKPAKFLAVIMK